MNPTELEEDENERSRQSEAAYLMWHRSEDRALQGVGKVNLWANQVLVKQVYNGIAMADVLAKAVRLWSASKATREDIFKMSRRYEVYLEPDEKIAAARLQHGVFGTKELTDLFPTLRELQNNRIDLKARLAGLKQKVEEQYALYEQQQKEMQETESSCERRNSYEQTEQSGYENVEQVE